MLCGICLIETSQIINVFDDLGIQLNVAEIVQKHLYFKPLLNDSWSANICTNCWEKIDDFHKFYEQIEKIHQDYDDRQTIIKVENEEVFEDNLLQINVEIKENDIELKNPLDNESNENYKYYESENEEDFEENEPSEISNEDYETLEKDTKTNDKKSPNKQTQKRKSKTTKAANTETTKRRKMVPGLDLSLTEEAVKKHVQMACNLCVFVGQHFSDISEHFKQHHKNVKPYVMCCNRKFTKNCILAEHAYIQENPNAFSCSECNKTFTTNYGLRTHIISYHYSEEESSREESGPSLKCPMENCESWLKDENSLKNHIQSTHLDNKEYNCPECDRVFPNRSSLWSHKHYFHTKQVFRCEQCDKTFKKALTLKEHMTQHTGETLYNCPFCTKTFNSNANMHSHKKKQHPVEWDESRKKKLHYNDSGPKIKCPMPSCDSWLKDEDSLKVHLRRHNTDNEAYKCPLCDKICPNRRALSSHKAYVHSKAKFKCEHCDKAFKRAINLREHMTQHTGEALYSCPFCARTFNSNGNMHAHKKKQHPVEWEASKRQKMIGITPDISGIF